MTKKYGRRYAVVWEEICIDGDEKRIERWEYVRDCPLSVPDIEKLEMEELHEDIRQRMTEVAYSTRTITLEDGDS
ncbi:MAG: hypothetical protein DRN55_06305 [Thermoplasmata archaeon]|nr:MAG: hypothetical protein DRN55_06305 [Thermoplasmata archaeon]